MSELWRTVADHRAHLVGSGTLETRREARLIEALRRVLQARLAERVEQVADGELFQASVKRLVARETDPYSAAEALLS